MNSCKKNKIEILEMFRFFAMTEVFIIHFMSDRINYGNGWSIPVVSGKLGVAFFFMITGYLLVKTSKTSETAIRFLEKKVITLVPKYEIVLLCIFFISRIKPSWFKTFDISYINFIKSIFLIPYKTEGVPFACPMLPVAWTLIVQFFVYIVFAIMNSIYKDNIKTAKHMSILFIALILMGCINRNDNIFLFTYCRFYMIYFICGFMAAIIEKKMIDHQSEILNGECLKYFSFAECLVGLLIFLLLSCIYKENLLFALIMFTIFLISLIISGGACKTKVKFSGTILYLGRISYSFYLLHYLVCKFTTRVLVGENSLILFLLAMIISYIMTILIAFIYNKVVDSIINVLKMRGA